MPKPNYMVFPISLNSAGTKTMRYAGKRFVFIKALRGTSLALDAVLNVSLGDNVDDFIPCSPNSKIWGETLVYKFQWDAQPNVIAHVMLSRPGEADGIDIDAPPASQLVVSAASGALVTVADVSVNAGAQAPIVAADATRREVLLSNLAANTATFRIGDANTGAARGVPLAPGQTLTLETTAAVYAWNPGGTAQSLAVTTL